MYIRTISRKNKDGSVVRYVQLAHNYYDGQAKQARARVLYNFGREDRLDRDSLRRLVHSIARYLGPEEALKVEARWDGEAPLKFVSSRSLGASWVLNEMWKGLKLDRLFSGMLKTRQYRSDIERAIFAIVANRALSVPGHGKIPTSGQTFSPLPDTIVPSLGQ